MTYSACRARHRGLYKFTALFSIKQPKNWGKLGIIPFPVLEEENSCKIKVFTLSFLSREDFRKGLRES